MAQQGFRRWQRVAAAVPLALLTLPKIRLLPRLPP